MVRVNPVCGVAVVVVTQLRIKNLRTSGLLPVCCAALWLASSTPALAHSPFSGSVEQRLASSISALLLLGFWLVYVRGSNRVSPRFAQELGFYLVCVICAITILGPLDELAENSTAAHMVQHMLLIVVIAPLWVLTRPLPQLVAGGLRALLPLWKPVLRMVSKPLTTAYLHGAVIWVWHIPWFYMLAVKSPGWHVVEHTCLLLTAGLFWWAVLRSSRRNLPNALLALLFTLIHTGFLGAVLTFSRVPLYEESRSMGDQQLAGMIMWVVGAFPYLLGVCWLVRRWYQSVDYTDPI